MNNKNIRIMQMVGILMVNNAFILLAVDLKVFLSLGYAIKWKEKSI